MDSASFFGVGDIDFDARFFGAAFLDGAFFAAAFFFAVGGIGMVIPPWLACCASAGAGKASSPAALTAANRFCFTSISG